MQKKLIAIAIATAFSAPAFADTTVYGIVDLAVTSINETGKKNDLNVTSGGLSTSRVGIKATEDLANGMKVIGLLEAAVDASSSSAPFGGAARQKMLALAGDFGTVAAGYLQTASYDFTNKFDPTAGTPIDAAHAVNPTALIKVNTRSPKALAYISPNMSGLTVAVNRAMDFAETGAVASGATTGNKTTANILSAMYDAGPLSVGAVYVGTANDDTGYAKVTEMGLGASYDLGAAKVSGAYRSTKSDATGTAGNTNKEIELHVIAPVTASGAVIASYAKNTIATSTNQDDSAITLAYTESLSATVTAYGAYSKATFKNGTAADSDKTVIAVGLRKKF